LDIAVRCDQAKYRLPVNKLRYLPNVITLLRLATAPVTVWLIAKAQVTPAFWLFLGASVTDAVDGVVARWVHAQSALGSYLDALADKVLLVGVFVSLGVSGLLNGWLVGLVVGRDVLLVVAALALRFGGVQRQVIPLLISKVNTVVQILLAAVVLGHQGLGWFPLALVAPLSGIVALTTVMSAFAYLAAWWPRLLWWKE
jgi:cardiolipin synthase